MECTVGKDADEETGGGDGVSSAAATAEPSELAQKQPASAVEVSQLPIVQYGVLAKSEARVRGITCPICV